MKKSIICFALLIFITSLLPAADVPPRINYQGVLRDSSDNPINGTVGMIFRFYDSSVGGSLLWEEDYGVVIPPGITVTNGLFSVALGDPVHRAYGDIPDFQEIFKNYTNVYLALAVGTDPEMTPRIKIISSAYALNAELLGGKHFSEYIDIGSIPQIKWGQLTLNASGAYSGYGVEGYGPDAGGFFQDSNSSGYAYVGYGNRGIGAFGSFMGGYFQDSDQSGYANVGYGDTGIEGFGNSYGGYFQDSDNSGRAYVGYWDYGIYALGNYMAGYFQDWDSSGRAYIGYGDNGITAYGSYTAGYFQDWDNSGHAYVGYGDSGIEAYGYMQGGYFKDSDNSGEVRAGYGDRGIEAYGYQMGGYFRDSDNSGYSYVGVGEYGILGYGNYTGGYFKDLDSSGYAYVGNGDYGIEAYGYSCGGYFKDLDHSGYAYVGNGDYGIQAYGYTEGGHFEDLDGTSYANVALSAEGIDAYGNAYGGYFVDLNSSAQGIVGYSTYKISGSGTVSFVQNHPYSKNQVIVYAAPEGDEVATYTRGTARLINGEARIPLGETFKWVTNPDIGLTAYLTPHGDCNGLYMDSLTTSELVVKELGGGTGNVTFDYIVYGLRIGFEESSIIQEKTKESYIPSMKDHRDLYTAHPELQSYNALERFKNMRTNIGMGETIDLSNSLALKNAIHEYDPITDLPVCELFGNGPCPKAIQPRPVEAQPQPALPAASPAASVPVSVHAPFKSTDRTTSKLSEALISVPSVAASGGSQQDASAETEAPSVNLFPVSEPIEIGDLLTLDILNPGQFQKGRTAADRNVVGIVAAEPIIQDGQLKAALVETNFAIVKADATYGPILPGDLLVTSTTPGHAMKAPEVYANGSVIGKALEPMEAGTGLIKVLVMLR